MTLTEFLLARIAEDEERANFVQRQIEGNNQTPFEPWMLSWHDEYDLLCIEPSRALAECRAKGRIVAFAMEFRKAADKEADPVRKLLGEAMAESAEDALASIAMAYADHPDFREEWRVS